MTIKMLDFSAVIRKNMFSVQFAVVVLQFAVHVESVQATMCTQAETDAMQAKFTTCTGEMTTAYQSKVEEGSTEEALCGLFNSIVKDCGKIWEECHTQEDIGKIQKMQLEGLLGQYVYPNNVNMEGCDIVIQYWTADAVQEEGSTSYCTDRQYAESQTKFQACSDNVSNQVYQNFQEVQDPEVIKQMVCDGLTKIQDSCSNLLKNCFGPSDVSQMLNMHLKEIKKYLVSIAPIEIKEDSIDTCFVIAELQDANYDYYYATEEYSGAHAYDPHQGVGTVEEADAHESETAHVQNGNAHEQYENPQVQDENAQNVQNAYHSTDYYDTEAYDHESVEETKYDHVDHNLENLDGKPMKENKISESLLRQALPSLENSSSEQKSIVVTIVSILALFRIVF